MAWMISSLVRLARIPAASTMPEKATWCSGARPRITAIARSARCIAHRADLNACLPPRRVPALCAADLEYVSVGRRGVQIRQPIAAIDARVEFDGEDLRAIRTHLVLTGVLNDKAVGHAAVEIVVPVAELLRRPDRGVIAL